MPDDERLREALLELELLRAREARTHRTTRALLDCIEAYSKAPDPDAALDALFRSLAELTGAERSLVLHVAAGRSGRVIACDNPAWVGSVLGVPFDVSGRVRVYTDLHAAGRWECQHDLSRFRAAVVVPATGPHGTQHALLCLRANGAFPVEAQTVMERVAGLAVQAVATRALAAEKDLLAATIEGSSSSFSIADATRNDLPLVYVNAAFERLSGYSANEVLGRNCRFLNDEAPDAPIMAELRATIAARGPGRFVLRNVRKSGERFWNELTLFPISGADGAVSHLVATQIDVSEQVEARADRDRAQARMSRALAATDDAVLLVDRDGTVVYANGAVSALFPQGCDWRKGEPFAAQWAAYLDHMRPITGRNLPALDLEGLTRLPAGREMDLPDGRTVLIRARDLGDDTLVLWATNITAQKAARALLEQRLSAIEAAFDGIAIVDDDGRLAYLNPAAARALGFRDPALALGRVWSSRYEGVGLPDARAGFAARLRRASHGDAPAAEHDITASALSGGGAVLVLRDVTDRVAMERRETVMREALVQAQRREAVAQLAAGIAHDFNNLLSAINGSAMLIATDPSSSDAARTHAGRVSAAGARAARLVNRLLDMGSAADVSGAFDLRDALSDVPKLVQSSLPNGTAFEVAAPTGAVVLQGDPGALNQIVVNLIFNARDALGGAPGTVSLEICTESPAATRRLRIGALEGGRRYACVSVSDTGAGMDEETMAQIFDAYFTTKGRRGTGLGLAMVASQVTAVGGGIDVQSSPGAGTRFTVYWPCADGRDESASEGAALAPDALAGMTVLVVDDEPEVGEVLQTYLERFGAEVALCDDPRDAAEAVEEAPEAWCALITDYDMPHMTGGDLAERVARAAPTLPVFLATALARRLTDPRVAPGRIAGVFAKPVDLAQLSRALASAQEDRDATADRR